MIHKTDLALLFVIVAECIAWFSAWLAPKFSKVDLRVKENGSSQFSHKNMILTLKSVTGNHST